MAAPNPPNPPAAPADPAMMSPVEERYRTDPSCTANALAPFYAAHTPRTLLNANLAQGTALVDPTQGHWYLYDGSGAVAKDFFFGIIRKTIDSKDQNTDKFADYTAKFYSRLIIQPL